MPKSLSDKNIALVFDWLDDKGGMEQVNLAMADLFPQAQIFTSVYEKSKFPELKGRMVKTTWLQKLPKKLRPKHQLLAPLMPWAFRSLDLSKFDVILSSASSGYSKCVKKTRPDQTHICYCHTPVRYLYNAREEYLNDYPLPWFLKPFKWLLPLGLDWLHKVDQAAAKEVDHFIANSKFVAARVQKYYGQKATVIYPGISDKNFVLDKKNSSKKDYFLALGRFIPYKRFDLLVETFAANKLPLKLAGVGPELERCKKLAEKLKATNIEFLGFVDEKKIRQLYTGASGFLFPAEEDFGLTPVEAMAAGVPVIYYNGGGAVESVGTMGVAFKSQTAESLQVSLDEFAKKQPKFSATAIQKQARQFTTEVFQKNLLAFVNKHR